MTEEILLNGFSVTRFPFLLGKHPSNDFLLHSQTASRFHARIIRSKTDTLIVDQNSKNGVFVNKHAGEVFTLKDGDIINLGNDSVVVQFREKAPDRAECPEEMESKEENGISSDFSRKILIGLYKAVLEIMDEDKNNLPIPEIISLAERSFTPFLELAERDKVELRRQLENEISGPGPLEDLMGDPDISEIMVNGHDAIYVEKNGRIERTELAFISERTCLNMIERLVALQGGRLDESMPYIDTRLEDGSRLNVIIPPASLFRPHLTIRKFNNEKFDFQGLITCHFIPEEIRDFLQTIIKAQKNILISGNTGSGKTTLLNALSEFIDNSHRIITIEDAAELNLRKEHLITLQSRRPNVEGSGEITSAELLRNALRMRPDRIIIGECRGEETPDMLQAMNTGHDGSMSTIHANSARDALRRIETIILLKRNLNPRGIREQIASALDFVIHTERDGKGKRQISEIIEITGIEDDVIIHSAIYQNGLFHPELMGPVPCG